MLVGEQEIEMMINQSQFEKRPSPDNQIRLGGSSNDIIA